MPKPSTSEPAGVIHRVGSVVRSIRFGEVSRYSLLAAISAVMTLGLPVAFHEWLGIGERTAVALALAIAFVVNFVGAKSYVFKSTGALGAQLLRYAAANAGFRVAEYMAFIVLHTAIGLFYVLALGLVLVTSFVVKFVFYRTFVFTSAETG